MNNSGPIIDIFSTNIRYWHHINESFVFFSSLVSNFILIVLLITERNEVLRAYTRVLLQTCVIDLLYTVTIYFTEMVRFLIMSQYTT